MADSKLDDLWQDTVGHAAQVFNGFNTFADVPITIAATVPVALTARELVIVIDSDVDVAISEESDMSTSWLVETGDYPYAIHVGKMSNIYFRAATTNGTLSYKTYYI